MNARLMIARVHILKEEVGLICITSHRVQEGRIRISARALQPLVVECISSTVMPLEQIVKEVWRMEL